MRQTREDVLKGKAKYGWSLCTNLSVSAAFDNENIISFFAKQGTLMRRSTVLDLSLQ
jgi:hypothetical protein